MEYTWKTPKKTQEELRAMWDKATPASNEMKASYVDEEGKTQTYSINLLDGLVNTLNNYKDIVLPELPDTFVPNDVSSSEIVSSNGKS